MIISVRITFNAPETLCSCKPSCGHREAQLLHHQAEWPSSVTVPTLCVNSALHASPRHIVGCGQQLLVCSRCSATNSRACIQHPQLLLQPLSQNPPQTHLQREVQQPETTLHPPPAVLCHGRLPVNSTQPSFWGSSPPLLQTHLQEFPVPSRD